MVEVTGPALVAVPTDTREDTLPPVVQDHCKDFEQRAEALLVRLETRL